MRIDVPHAWPDSADEAVDVQLRLRPLVDRTAPSGLEVRTAAGLDVSYAPGGNRLVAAVVVIDSALQVVDSAVVPGATDFPYVPGLFAFRELPALVTALERLTVPPDLLICDGQGIAHPRRFGLACHVGVLTGLPTIGVAKTPLGSYLAPGRTRGSRSPLLLDGDEVGAALRTQDDTRPVFVSVGHRVDLDRACQETLRFAPRYRLPETTRQADHVSRAAL